MRSSDFNLIRSEFRAKMVYTLLKNIGEQSVVVLQSPPTNDWALKLIILNAPEIKFSSF